MRLAWTGISFCCPSLCVCIILSLISMRWMFHPLLLPCLFVPFSMCRPAQGKAGLCRDGFSCRCLCCFPSFGVELAMLRCLFPDHGGSWASSLFTASLLTRTPGKRCSCLPPLNFIPKPTAQCPGLGVLSQEGWERCPVVCSRVAWKDARF